MLREGLRRGQTWFSVFSRIKSELPLFNLDSSNAQTTACCIPRCNLPSHFARRWTAVVVSRRWSLPTANARVERGSATLGLASSRVLLDAQFIFIYSSRLLNPILAEECNIGFPAMPIGTQNAINERGTYFKDATRHSWSRMRATTGI